jgi:hypothetical protein
VSHLSWETLVDYWAGEAADIDALDDHLMGCAECSALSARVAAITETLRSEIAMTLTAADVERLRARGLRVADNPMRPDERREVRFGRDIDILLHRLEVDLSRAERVDFRLTDEQTGATLVEIEDVRFDRDAGAVLVACQRHFSVFPPDNVAELRVYGPAPAAFRYTIRHRWA